MSKYFSRPQYIMKMAQQYLDAGRLSKNRNFEDHGVMMCQWHRVMLVIHATLK